MTWQSSILPILFLINAGIALVILQVTWQRRQMRGAVPFFWMVLAVAIWSFTGAMELLVSDFSQKILWGKLQYFGIVSLPVQWLLFALEYSQAGDQPSRLRRSYRLLLWIIPVITLLLVLTNELHGLIWSGIVPIQALPNSLIRYEHGIWFWVFAAYSYLLIFVGTLVLIIGAARSSPDSRQQTTMLVVGAAIPWIANFVYLSGWPVEVAIDLTPIAFCITSVIYTFQVFRYQFLDLVPIAQDTIVESMRDGVVVLDLKGRIVYINPAARKILKTGNSIENAAKDAHFQLPTFANNENPNFPEVVELQGDGLPSRYLECRASPLHDEHKRLTGQVIVFSDITQRKREEERFKSLLDATPDGIIVIDQKGCVIMANLRAEQMLGYQADEINLQPLTTILPDFQTDLFDPLKGYQENPALSDRSISREVSALTKDGHELPIEIAISQLSTPEGLVSLAMLRDLSMQKAAEEQLNQQSVALASAASAIVITDRQGLITWVNPSFTNITGYTAEEVIGKKPSILKSGFHDEKFYAELWSTILAGENWHGELTNRRKDGSLFVEESTIAPVRNPKGEISHFIAVKQDITKRKELEQMRDDLMQTIVHDLRNPLTSILFALDMIKDQPDAMRLPPEMAMMLAISRDNSWRMLGMVNAMLDYSKLESGKMPLQREPITLAELVEQSFRFQSQLAARRELLLLNDVPYDLPAANADRTLVSRVLQNLIDNAIKYAPPGSNIVIQACVDSGRDAILVTVHDQGAGIPSEMRNHLFQKFAAEKSTRGGTGLGLAFCRLAIEAHKGEIWVESEENQGTTFFFTLPIEDNLETKRS